jgi:N-acetylglutamate synthase-like GNAT family acetyltransferase
MIRQPKPADWEIFYGLAAEEGWRVPQVERQLLMGPWSDYAQVLEVDSNFAGLVTAVGHEQSGWIGNLIVPAHLRGRGYGGRLFLAALDDLADRSISKVWLTASAQGQPLYEKSGFVAVDRVERWVSMSREMTCSSVESGTTTEKTLRDGDRMAWGENRSVLLDHLLEHGQPFACDDSVALLQKGPDMQMIGPWYSQNGCPRASRLLLQGLLAAADPSIEIVADLLASSPLRQLLAAAGFERIGETALMVHGEQHVTNLGMMVSLASLGSLG